MTTIRSLEPPDTETPAAAFVALARLPAWRSLFRLIWRLFGLNIGLLSADGRNFIPSGRQGRVNRFCAAMQRLPRTYGACLHSDRMALEQVRKTHLPLAYCCHAGLREFALPIMVDQTLVAVMLSGQILDHPPTLRGWRHTRAALCRLGLPARRVAPLKPLFLQSRWLPKDRQRDVLLLLSLFANQIMHLQARRASAGQALALPERARRYLQDHAAEPVTLAAAAQALRVSVRHLGRTFKAAADTTVHAYLRDLRLARACDRLAQTRQTCSEIAFACGFGSIQQFNRAFKQHTHLTPTAWRRRARGTLDRA